MENHDSAIGPHLVASLKTIQANPAMVNALQKMAQWHVLVRREVPTGPSQKRRRIEQNDEKDDPMDVSSVNHLTSLPELDEQIFQWLLSHSAASEERYVLIRKLLSVNKATSKLVEATVLRNEDQVPADAHLETLLIGTAQLNAPDLFIDLASLGEHELMGFDSADTNAAAAIIQAAAHYKRHGRDDKWIKKYIYKLLDTADGEGLEKIIEYGIMISDDGPVFRPDQMRIDVFSHIWQRYELNLRGSISRHFFSDAAIRLVDRVFTPLINEQASPDVLFKNIDIFLKNFCEKVEDDGHRRCLSEIVRKITDTFPPAYWIPDLYEEDDGLFISGDRLLLLCPQIVPLRVMETACRRGLIHVPARECIFWVRSMAFAVDYLRYYRLVINILSVTSMDTMTAYLLHFFNQLNGASGTVWERVNNDNSPFAPMKTASHALRVLISWLSDKPALINEVGKLYLATMETNSTYGGILWDAIEPFIVPKKATRISYESMTKIMNLYGDNISAPILIIAACYRIELHIQMHDHDISPIYFMWNCLRTRYDDYWRKHMPARPQLLPLTTHMITREEQSLIMKDIENASYDRRQSRR